MPTANLPLLSFSSITSFSTCQRRYALRYRSELGWPLLPAGDAVASEEREELGQLFHLAVEQRMRGQNVTDLLNQSPELHGWWLGFLRHRFDRPDGEVWHEARLQFVYAGVRWQVVLDRLQHIQDKWLIWDWKTGRRFERAELADNWQTRLYRFAVAHAGSHFTRGTPIPPAAVTMVYWSAAHDTVERFPYDEAAYEADGLALAEMAETFRAAEAAGFPPTGLGIACQAKGRPCPYVPLCLSMPTDASDEAWEAEDGEPEDEEEDPFV